MDDEHMGLTPVTSDTKVYEQLAAALYGDGAWELISKATAAEKKRRERIEAQVGLGSNILGLAAGTAGTASAYGALREVRQSQPGYKPKPPKKPSRIASLRPVQSAARHAGNFSARHPVGLAGAALGLQGANVAGDAVANRVLARSAKKPEKKRVSKKQAEIQPSEVKGKLVKVSVNSGFEAAKALPKVKEKTDSFTAKGKISKSVEDKRQVFGWASIVELNGEPVVDLQGDYMKMETIEKAAYQYVNKSRKGSDMHAGHHASDLIESFIVTEDKKKILGLPDSTPTGWWVGFQVNDDGLWQLVKDGKRPEFSIHGSGQRVDVEI